MSIWSGKSVQHCIRCGNATRNCVATTFGHHIKFGYSDQLWFLGASHAWLAAPGFMNNVALFDQDPLLHQLSLDDAWRVAFNNRSSARPRAVTSTCRPRKHTAKVLSGSCPSKYLAMAMAGRGKQCPSPLHRAELAREHRHRIRTAKSRRPTPHYAYASKPYCVVENATDFQGKDLKLGRRQIAYRMDSVAECVASHSQIT